MNDVLRRTKICFIVGTLSQGGAERQLYYMLRTLREQENMPTVLCLTQREFWESRIRELGVPIIWVGQNGARPVRLVKIINEVRRLKPDILQSSHFYTNLYAAFTGMFLGIAAIGAMRNDCFSEVRATGKVFGMLNLKVPRLIAGNSRLGIRNALALKVDEQRLFFLPNVVDHTEFSCTSRNSSNPIIVLTAGRLVEQKRMDRFISAIAHLRVRMHLPIKGVIVGEGPLRHQLEQQARKLGVNETDLEFRGLSVSMPEVYKMADIFVLTSKWEGTPNVVLEAMASGLPVVSTNVGGVTDLIRNGESGVIVDAWDEEGFAMQLLKLTENPLLRKALGTNARYRVENCFSLQRLSSHLESLYITALR